MADNSNTSVEMGSPLNQGNNALAGSPILNTAIAYAVSKPRDVSRAIANCITWITQDKELAEDCTYTLKKGKTIVGPSVVLARLMARELGNIFSYEKVINANLRTITAEAMVYDLEKNYFKQVQIERSIISRDANGVEKRYSDDLITITGNAAKAIAFRNAFFDVMPEHIVTKVWNAAKRTANGNLDDEQVLVAARISAFNKLTSDYKSKNLTEEEILKFLGRNVISEVTKDDVIALGGLIRSLKDNTEITFETAFRPQDKKEPKPVVPVDKSEERMLALLDKVKTKDDFLKINQADCTSVATKTKWSELNKKFSQ